MSTSTPTAHPSIIRLFATQRGDCAPAASLTVEEALEYVEQFDEADMAALTPEAFRACARFWTLWNMTVEDALVRREVISMADAGSLKPEVRRALLDSFGLQAKPRGSWILWGCREKRFAHEGEA